MSYIAFDLDALNRAPAAARSAGVSEETIIAGLVRMWAWCFREKQASITADQVRGHFGADVAHALVAFDFLESTGETWRVKGADRYLRVTEQRRNAGKSRAASAGRSAGKFAGAAPAKDQRNTSDSQRGASEEPALTPNTEHLAPNVKSMATAAQSPRESDVLLEDFKAATGSAYLWAGARDGKAFAQLRKVATIEEIRIRWRRGLAMPESEWTSVRTVAQLAMRWNDLATSKAAPQQPAKPVLRHL